MELVLGILLYHVIGMFIVLLAVINQVIKYFNEKRDGFKSRKETFIYVLKDINYGIVMLSIVGGLGTIFIYAENKLF
ncbi:hypothetical protein [Halocella sp. SP3-1]|uniref:hypothetical protein n=1 Tax=Halocella sp. SP3-1 TaxID=2382161 RepID=UPI000F762BFD|nr:hypothetical protein [Halocella sp. SP3-1]AZO96148.1 hypothetical protein D7D81_16980 [Halocella sp. SP3-1]